MKDLSPQEAMALVEAAQRLSQAERLRLRDERLRALVAYARENSPYFQTHYAGVPTDFTLADLPPTDKPALMARYEDWVCDRAVTATGVLGYLERQDAGLYLDKYTALTTSGTTGAPMPMVRDRTHNAVHGALVAKRLLRALPDMFDPAKHRIASIIFTDPHVSSYGAFLRAKAARPEFAQNMLAISPVEGTAAIVRTLNEYQPDVVSCYPSAMCALAVEQQKGTLHLTLKAIACSAEVLTEEMYTLFRETFGCPVINNYCSTEGGEAAMASDCPHLHVNEDWVILEPVDAERNPVRDPDVWSDGVLVTDLSNYVQPILRYYMNDRIKLHSGCACGSDFPYMQIQGRVGGVATVCGKSIMIVNFYPTISYTEGTYALQIAQTAPDALEIRALFAPGADRAAVFASVEARLGELLAREGCVGCRVSRSDKEPQRNQRGGKLQNYIRLY